MPRPLARKTPIISISLTSEHHFSNPSHESVHNYRFYGQPSKAVAQQSDIMKTIDHRTDDEDRTSYEYICDARLSDIAEEDEETEAKDVTEVESISVVNAQSSFHVEAEVNEKWSAWGQCLMSLFLFPCSHSSRKLEDSPSPRAATGISLYGIADKFWAVFF